MRNLFKGFQKSPFHTRPTLDSGIQVRASSSMDEDGCLCAAAQSLINFLYFSAAHPIYSSSTISFSGTLNLFIFMITVFVVTSSRFAINL